MDRHIKALGILYIATSGLGILLAAGMAALLSFLRTVFGDGAGAGEITYVGRKVVVLIVLFLVFGSVSGLVGGIGLLMRRAWARVLVLVLGFINLVFIPIGTILGIYTIWALSKPEAIALFTPGPAESSSDGLPAHAGATPKDYRLSGLIWIAGGIAFAICVGVSVGAHRGVERAVVVGVWGLIPLAVGVAMLLYGMTAHRDRLRSSGTAGEGGVNLPGSLCLILTGSLFASTAVAYTHEETVQKTLPASGITKITVSNPKGYITVEPWDRPEISVEAKKRIERGSKESAEADARQIEIAVETKGSEVEVRTIMPWQKEEWDWVEGFFSFDWLFEGIGGSRSVSCTISAPRKMNLDLTGRNAGIKVGAMEGRVDLKSANGSLTVEGFQGDLRGRSANGKVELSRMSGSCDIGTSNGRITAEFLRIGGQGCRFRTSNGSIRVVLPESIRVDIDASTSNGRFSSDLPISLLGENTRRQTRGKINGGGPLLELRTANGSIRVEKAEAKRVVGAPDLVLSDATQDVPQIPKQPLPPGGKSMPYFLRIQVWEGGDSKVKITVPVSLAEHALRHLPEEVRVEMEGKGIDIDHLLADLLKRTRPGRLVDFQDDDSRVQIDLVEE